MSQDLWMVSVQGGNAPSKYHSTLVDAKAEAERLACLTGNRNNRVYVLKVEAVLEPKNSHQWNDFPSNVS